MSLQPLSGPQTPIDFIIVIPSDVGGTFLIPEGLVLSSSGAWVSLGHLSIRPCFPGHRVQGHWDGPDSLQQGTCPNSARTMLLALFTPWLGDHGWPALPKGPQEREFGEKLPPARAEPPYPQSLPKGKPWAFTHWTLGALGAEASCAWGGEVAEKKGLLAFCLGLPLWLRR